MMQKNLKIVLAGLFILFFLGSLGIQTLVIHYVGVIGFLLILLFLYRTGTKIILPDNIKLYSVFLIIFLVSIFWSKDPFTTYEFFLLFLSGGIAYVVFYNLKITRKIFTDFILILGIFFGSMFFVQAFFQIDAYNEYSLYLFSTLQKNHAHIGDFWAVITVLFLYKLLTKRKKFFDLSVLVLGLFLLIFSYSRSAVISSMAGIFYLFKYEKIKKSVSPKIIKAALLVFVLLFIFLSLNKSLVFNRPYYWQTFFGLIRAPLGVGVGNFAFISFLEQSQIPGFQGYSYITHNLLLEIVAGMGVLSFVFIIWFFKVLSYVLQNRNYKVLIYELIFITLSLNFMFDVTYFVPSMLWLWFASLGLIKINLNK